MQQVDIDRAVARATGESVGTIRRLGFLLEDPFGSHDATDADLLDAPVIDWDAYETARYEGGVAAGNLERIAS